MTWKPFENLLNDYKDNNCFGDGNNYGNGNGNGGGDGVDNNHCGYEHGYGYGDEAGDGTGDGYGSPVLLLLCIDPSDLRCRVMNILIHPVFEMRRRAEQSRAK